MTYPGLKRINPGQYMTKDERYEVISMEALSGSSEKAWVVHDMQAESVHYRTHSLTKREAVEVVKSFYEGSNA